MRVLLLLLLASGAAVASPCEDDPKYDRPQKDRHGPRMASAKEFVGKTQKQLVDEFGEPYCKSRAKWRYARPPGCAYEREMVTLWFRGGKVARVNIVHEFTGEECMDVQ